MIVRWLDDAKYDLSALRHYISLNNPIAANRVAKKILNTVGLLSEHPYMGRPGRILNTRELIITNTPYITPYRLKNNVVEIIRIYHGSMKWPEKFNELYSENEYA